MTTEKPQPYAGVPDCECGHRAAFHHMTEKAPRRHTWCSAHKPAACACTQYRPEVKP